MLPRRSLLLLATVVALVTGGLVLSCVTALPVPLLPWDVPLTFGPDDIGGPRSGALAELQLPGGSPPYPVVVILSGCAGLTTNEYTWSDRLAGWGYAAALIEPFHHRRLRPSCDRTRVDIDLRARDAVNLADTLRRRPEFAGQRMGVLGFSSGARSALYAALDGGVPGDGRPSPFSAVVAYYPPCVLPAADSRLAVDAQVFVGSADYPRIVRSCHEMAAALAGTAHAPRVTFYPDAMHIFDTPGGNAAAAADSFAVTRAFLDSRLKLRE